MQALLRFIRKHFKETGKWENTLDDSASMQLNGKRLLFTTDSFIVKPLFFKGGNIGKLAVCGTLNDLAVMGAEPIAMACSLVIEEGFSRDKLAKILKAVGDEAARWDVPIVTGDTKVMPRRGVDRIVINTSGLGFAGQVLEPSRLRPGHKIIISGGIGEHAASILARRFSFETQLRSDCKCLLEEMRAIRNYASTAKDPTRGGLAAALNEIAERACLRITIEEDKVPIRREVHAISELLGLEPLGLACEGRVVLGVPEEDADKAVGILKRFNDQAAIIGYTTKGDGVILKTRLGERALRNNTAESIARIC